MRVAPLFLLVTGLLTASSCGTMYGGASLAAGKYTSRTVDFAIANRSSEPIEVAIYRDPPGAGPRAADRTIRKRVAPNDRVVVTLDPEKMIANKIPEVEIVGLRSLKEVEVTRATELIVHDHDQEVPAIGFAGLWEPSKRYPELKAKADAGAAEERAKAEAVMRRPDQPGYTLGPPGPFKVGDPVVGWWRETFWYQAHVIAKGRGTVTVRYTVDGAEETLVDKPTHVRHRIGGDGPYVYRAPAPADEGAPAAPTPAKACHGKGYKTNDRSECCSDMLASENGFMYCCDYSSGQGFCSIH